MVFHSLTIINTGCYTIQHLYKKNMLYVIVLYQIILIFISNLSIYMPYSKCVYISQKNICTYNIYGIYN